MTDFFISYTQADREWAEWIAWVLEEAGHHARIQAWDFQPGCNFVVEMNKAAVESDRTLAVLSPDFLKSLYATHEWTAAFADGKLLPVRVRDMKLEGLLAPISYIDLVNLNEAVARERLVSGVVPGRRKPRKRPGFPGGSAPRFPGGRIADPDEERGLSFLEKLPLDEVPNPAPLPAGSRMPHAVNPMFVGRDEDLRVLARALKGGESAALGQVAAATGLGGIGKTQLVSEFAHRYGQFFEGGVFWMSFAEPAGVPAEVAACGRNLGLHPQFEGLPLEQQVQLVRDSWLSPLPRLLVFDNCEEPDLLQEWRPTTGRARVLLTSRRAQWDPAFGIHSHALETLSRSASVELLRRFRPDLSEGDPILGEIAQELGDLPLALHLAGSFLHRYRHANFGQPKVYLEDLRRGDLLSHSSLQGQPLGKLPTGHAAHVVRTFALSYERLNPNDWIDFLAQRLLARASHFAPGEPIPRKLLLATVQGEQKSLFRKLLLRLFGLFRKREPAAVPSENALERLVDLGLIKQGEDGHVVMHRLVTHFAKLEEHGTKDQRAVEEVLLRTELAIRETSSTGSLIFDSWWKSPHSVKTRSRPASATS